MIIRQLRSDARAADLLTYLDRTGDLLAPFIVAFEIFRGCRNEIERHGADALFRDLAVTDLTYPIAVAAGRLMQDWAGIFSSEKAVPDALIAATAVELPATLVTLNTRQFSRLKVPGLDVLLIDQEAADWFPLIYSSSGNFA